MSQENAEIVQKSSPRWHEAIRRDCERVRSSPTALVGVLAPLAALRISDWPQTGTHGASDGQKRLSHAESSSTARGLENR
jgi:hypothetical protein